MENSNQENQEHFSLVVTREEAQCCGGHWASLVSLQHIGDCLLRRLSPSERGAMVAFLVWDQRVGGYNV